MHQRTCATIVALILTAVSAGAQQITVLPGPGGEPFPLPQRLQTKTGTGRISGRLVTPDTGAPVRRAQIRISSPDILPKTATTDQEGRYEFRELPAGRFTITATKSGWVTVTYGQTRPFEAGKPIELVDGQAVTRADITMPRGSAIAGRIIDEFGEPVADVAVSAMRTTWQNGRRRLQSTGRAAMTNDLGQYRVYGLPPGEYVVSATNSGVREMVVAEFAMAASIAGGPASESPRSGYAPTHYPGTPSGAQAQRVTVALGQEAQSIDFALVPVRLVKVSGTVISSDGRPLEGVQVNAAPRTTDGGASVFPPAQIGRTDRNGNFTINGIAPGDYTLTARGGDTIMTSGSDGERAVFTMTRRVVDGAPSGSQTEFGSVPLTVAAEDVTNVMVVTSKGTSVSGRVVYEGGSKPTANTLRITAAPADAEGPMALMGGSASVTAEGTFEIRGLAGPRLFRVATLPAGWVLKAIRLNGDDITDTGTDVRGSDPITGLEVVLTSRGTQVGGTVKAGNDPATEYTVVIFSDDPQKWTVPTARHIASARPNQEGRFDVKNLPAGSYYAIALEYIAQGDWFDPDVLERLKNRATRFIVGEGQTETLDLRLESFQ